MSDSSSPPPSVMPEEDPFVTPAKKPEISDAFKTPAASIIEEVGEHKETPEPAEEASLIDKILDFPKQFVAKDSPAVGSAKKQTPIIERSMKDELRETEEIQRQEEVRRHEEEENRRERIRENQKRKGREVLDSTSTSSLVRAEEIITDAWETAKAKADEFLKGFSDETESKRRKMFIF